MDTARCLLHLASQAVLLGPRAGGHRVATELDHRLGRWSQRAVGKSSH